MKCTIDFSHQETIIIKNSQRLIFLQIFISLGHMKLLTMRIFSQKIPSNVFQTLSPQKINNPNQNTRNYVRLPSNQRGLFHTDPTTFSHVINRGFPRNAEASGVKSIHSPIHSTPCFEPKAESPEICSQNQFNFILKRKRT